MILNGLVDVETTSILDTYSSQCRGPLIKLRPRKCKYTYYLNYFGNRVPSLWNSLPNNISSCKSVNRFRIMLNIILSSILINFYTYDILFIFFFYICADFYFFFLTLHIFHWIMIFC